MRVPNLGDSVAFSSGKWGDHAYNIPAESIASIMHIVQVYGEGIIRTMAV